MPAVLFVVVLLDPAEYAGLARLLPAAYRDVVPGLLRVDEIVTLSVAVLSLFAAVQRARGDWCAGGWTPLASYVFLVVPSLVGLLPFGYGLLRVRKRELRARRGLAAGE